MTDADVDGSHIRTLLLTFCLPPDVRPGEDRLRLRGPAALCSACGIRKRSNYVQTEEEMKAQLLDAGLTDAVFEPGDGRTIKGKEMDGSAARWLRWRSRSWRWSAPRHQPPRPRMRRDPVTGPAPDISRLSSASRSTGSPRARSSTSSSPPRNKSGRGTGPYRERRGRRGEAAAPQQAAHRRVARGPLDEQPVGGAPRDGLRDRQF